MKVEENFEQYYSFQSITENFIKVVKLGIRANPLFSPQDLPLFSPSFLAF